MGMNHTKCAYWATLDGRTRDLEWHIQNGANLSGCNQQTGRTLLHLASERGNDKCVELILQNSKGHRLNHRDHDENTPLNVAVFWNHVNTVSLLLSYGADPNINNVTHRKLRFYRSPLHIAATKLSTTILNQLIEHGCSIDIQDSWGYTPLMVAISSKSLPCALRLLQAGANTEMIDYYYIATALQIAMNESFLDAIPMLLHFGANPNATPNRLQSPLIQAIDMKFVYIAVMLIEYGAKFPTDYFLVNKLNNVLDNRLADYCQSVRSLKSMCRIITRKIYKGNTDKLVEYCGTTVAAYLHEDYACYYKYLIHNQ